MSTAGAILAGVALAGVVAFYACRWFLRSTAADLEHARRNSNRAAASARYRECRERVEAEQSELDRIRAIADGEERLRQLALFVGFVGKDGDK